MGGAPSYKAWARLREGFLNGFRVRAPAVALALALLCAMPMSAPANAGLPDLGSRVPVGTLPTGTDFIVYPMNDVPVVSIELWYRAPSVGFGAIPVPSLARLAAEVVVASRPITGKPLGSVVREAGGHIGVSVYADSVEISIMAPSSAASALVRAMTTAFFAPVVTETGYREAQRLVEQEALIGSFSPNDVLRDAVFGALFRSGPAHYPVLGNARAIEGISLETVRAYASRAFRSQNAVLVAGGAVDASLVKAAVSGRAAVSSANARMEPAISSVPAGAPRFISKTWIKTEARTVG